MLSGKTFEKWKPIIESLGLPDNEEKKDWLSDYFENHCYFGCLSSSTSSNSIPTNSIPNSSFPTLLPIAMKVASTTIGFGGWYKSKKQQQKENRLNKLRKLEGKDPNIILPDDEYQDGLVSVVPLSAPTNQLFYIDYKYESEQAIKKRIRKKKLIKIERIIKIKYIDEMLKNNT